MEGKFSKARIDNTDKPDKDVVDKLRGLVAKAGKTYSDEFYAGLTARKALAIIRKFEGVEKEAEVSSPERPDLPVGELFRFRRDEPPNGLKELPGGGPAEGNPTSGITNVSAALEDADPPYVFNGQKLIVRGADGAEIILSTQNGKAAIVLRTKHYGVSLGVGKNGPVIAMMRGGSACAELRLCPETGKAAILVPDGRGGAGQLVLDEVLDKLSPHWRDQRAEEIPET